MTISLIFTKEGQPAAFIALRFAAIARGSKSTPYDLDNQDKLLVTSSLEVVGSDRARLHLAPLPKGTGLPAGALYDVKKLTKTMIVISESKVSVKDYPDIKFVLDSCDPADADDNIEFIEFIEPAGSAGSAGSNVLGISAFYAEVIRAIDPRYAIQFSYVTDALSQCDEAHVRSREARPIRFTGKDGFTAAIMPFTYEDAT